MRKIRLISVGKIRDPHILAGESEYLKRLRGLSEITLVEVSPGKGHGPAEVMASEGQQILAKLRAGEYFITLQENGTQCTSKEFAHSLEAKMTRGISRVTFGIGGAFGWDGSVLARSNESLSLSRMTFPHELTRLILIEQIYRAFTILSGTPYHK